MKKPVVDYRTFRLSRINEPQFSHLKLLSGWIVYFVLFVLTENLIPAESCTPMHCWLDDIIPFCEAFVIPYVGWYLLIIGSLGYFLLYDIVYNFNPDDCHGNLHSFPQPSGSPACGVSTGQRADCPCRTSLLRRYKYRCLSFPSRRLFHRHRVRLAEGKNSVGAV